MRGRGYRPDPRHKRMQKDSRLLFGSAPSLKGFGSLDSFRAPVMDQGVSNSCTAHGTSQGLAIAFTASGKPLSFVVSPRGLYAVTGCLELSDVVGETLEDNGRIPSDIMVALSTIGVEPMGPLAPDGRFSDVTPDNVNIKPRLDEVETELVTIVTGTHRIDEKATDVLTQVAASIDAKCPVGVGAIVGPAFEAWGEGWDASRPPIGVATLAADQASGQAGGHWTVITSYQIMPDGTFEFGYLNSWGPSWGCPPMDPNIRNPTMGQYRTTGAWLQSAASDLYIFTPQLGNAQAARKAA